MISNSNTMFLSSIINTRLTFAIDKTHLKQLFTTIPLIVSANRIRYLYCLMSSFYRFKCMRQCARLTTLISIFWYLTRKVAVKELAKEISKSNISLHSRCEQHQIDRQLKIPVCALISPCFPHYLRRLFAIHLWPVHACLPRLVAATGSSLNQLYWQMGRRRASFYFHAFFHTLSCNYLMRMR